MNLKKAFYFLAIVGITLLCSFGLPSKLKKKVLKEVTKTFSVKEVTLEAVLIDISVENKLHKAIGKDHLFKIMKDEQLIGYAYVDKAPSKTDEFDYLILLDANLVIAKAKVLVYREDYGGEIGSRRWLKQFIGKKSNDQLKYERDVIAISGATISALSMTKAVNSFLKNVTILKENSIL